MEISGFSDIVILKIFSYLAVKELCIVSRVCRSWRRIAYDKTLWRDIVIDISQCQGLDLRKVWKFYRARLSDVLRSLKMIGYYNKRSGSERQKKQLLSDSLLEEISTGCPNIEELQLYRFYLDKLSSSKLPRSIIHLKLRECGWPLSWLNGANLLELQSLDVGKTVRIDDKEINDIVKFTSLEELNLEELYRVTDSGVKQLAEILTMLKILNLTSVKVSDLGVHHICRHLVKLRSLDLSYTQITDTSLDNIAKCLPDLKCLTLAGNNITDDGIKLLCNGKHSVKLIQLDISSTKITDKALIFISDKLINLEGINLAITKVTKEAISNLSDQLEKLTHINLGRGT